MTRWAEGLSAERVRQASRANPGGRFTRFAEDAWGLD
jgi:hypothetical protein